jgi:endonuclease YncB( thermonuclease family)
VKDVTGRDSGQLCPECGKPLSPGAKFCAECGHRLTAAETMSDTIVPPTPEPSIAPTRPLSRSGSPTWAPPIAAAPVVTSPVNGQPWYRRSRRVTIALGIAGLIVVCLCGTLTVAAVQGGNTNATRTVQARSTGTANRAAIIAAVDAANAGQTATIRAIPTPTRVPPTATPTIPPSPTPTATPTIPPSPTPTVTPAPPTAVLALPPTAIPTAMATTIAPSPTTIPATATPPGPILTLAQLVAVQDGATIKVRLPDNTEASVLMIGVDTPFPNECFGAESAARTTQLLEGQTVELEADQQDKNAAGQLLRYVWVWNADGIRRHVNLELAKGGLAAVYNAAPNGRYQADLDAAQKAAKSAGQGLWARCGKAHAPIPSTPTPLGRCSNTDAQRLINAIQSKANEWDDASQLANSTPRVALAPQIQNLQRIRRDTAALSVPSCGAKTLALLITYMDTTINAYIDFLGQGSQYSALFARASTQLEAFNAELRHVTIGP